MIKLKYLKKIKPLPAVLDIPNGDLIIDLIYSEYFNYKSIDEIDQYFNNKKNIEYYTNTLRPLIKTLFDLGQTKLSTSKLSSTDIEFLSLNDLSTVDVQKSSTVKSSVDIPSIDIPSIDIPSIDNLSIDNLSIDIPSIDIPSIDIPSIDIPSTISDNKISKLKIQIDLDNISQPIKPLGLNKSQKQVRISLQNNNLQSGIICHATGTGKTNCIFMIIGYSNKSNIYILCSHKNILKQMFYKSDTFDYDKFSQLKCANIFDIGEYDIYDLYTDTDNRKLILKNIDKITKTNRKRIFLINPQFIGISNRYINLPKPDIIFNDECHSITGNLTYSILEHYKKLDSVCIGLSATPVRNIRSDANYQLLKNIFNSNLNQNEINIISSYENITAIINDIILNIEIHWFEADLSGNSITNRTNEINIQNCLNQIYRVGELLPNKKVLVWCKLTSHANIIYEKISTDHNLKNMFSNGIFIDHSQLDSRSDKLTYTAFSEKPSNCIMICADKYREGSDIEYLDMVVFADFVKNKSELPFIQCIGRVQRKGCRKKCGTVIDHFDVSKDYTNKASDIINKLLGYYYQFFSTTKSISSDNKIDQAIKTYKDILDRYTFSNTNNQILINLDPTHNIIIHTKLSSENFSNVKNNFEPKIIQHVARDLKLSEDETLRVEYERFKTVNQSDIFYQFETKTEYTNRITDYGLEPEPEIKYAKFWINFYDYLGIDISIYPPDINSWRKLYKQYKIKTHTEYKSKAGDYGLPLMPEELYKIKSLVFEFSNKDEILM